MKILVLDSAAPFAPASTLAAALVERLGASGMEAEALRLPFTLEPAARLPDEVLIARSLRMLNADRIIALAFPAHLVVHAQKTIWLHQAPRGPGLAGRAGVAVREAEARSFGEAHRVFAASAEIAAALHDAYGCAAEILPGIPDRLDDLLA